MNQPVRLEPPSRFVEDEAGMEEVFQARLEGDEVEGVLGELGLFGRGHDDLLGSEPMQLDGPPNKFEFQAAAHRACVLLPLKKKTLFLQRHESSPKKKRNLINPPHKHTSTP